jgi:signal transduction histidine kinase
MASAHTTAGQSPADDPQPALEQSAREAPAAAPPAHAALSRRPDRGLLGGVCAGIAERLGVHVLIVRLVAAVVVVAAGVGVAVYALAWALIPVAPESQGVERPRGVWRETALTLVVIAGVLAGLRHTGLWIGDGIIWPLVLGACGLALVWRPTIIFTGRVTAGRSLSARERVHRLGQIDLPRLVVGVLLVAFASASLLHAFGVLHSLGKAIGAVAIVATMLGLLVGPWVVRQGRSLAAERSARIREQERAELAAHLHDSVLQTLALIQKRSGDPREVAGLARRQERELRHWLHERPSPNGQDSVGRALERAAAEVEDLHRVPIEVVTVGDGPLDGGREAMVQAAREAMCNAAKFSGAEHVDLYAEVAAGRVEMFVRDRGSGFDPVSIPTDRRGVRDSIIGRMERHHGRAAVHSSPGEGTEVELVLEGRPA